MRYDEAAHSAHRGATMDDERPGEVSEGLTLQNPFELPLMLQFSVLLAAIMLLLAWRGHFPVEHHTPVEVLGLYWHFVDVVWIFLYPLLYLMGRNG